MYIDKSIFLCYMGEYFPYIKRKQPLTKGLKYAIIINIYISYPRSQKNILTRQYHP